VPTCATVAKPVDSGSCWQSCACLCSWSKQKETYDTMTVEEQLNYNEQEVEEYL